MSSFDSGLSDLFPSENFAKMGNSRIPSNDEFSDIFKEDQPLSSIDTDINRIGAEDAGALGFSESEIQTHGIFDLLGDSCFKEPAPFSSLLSLDSDNLLLNSEPSKFYSSLESGTQDNVIEPGNNTIFPDVEKNSENQDSCIDKIVDILATFVDESSQELNFNNNILDHSQECLPSDVELSDNSIGKQFVESSVFQIADPSDGAVSGPDYLPENVPNSTVEDILMKTIALSNLETEIGIETSELCHETDASAVSQLMVSAESPPHPERKSFDRLLLPRLTKFGCDLCRPQMFFLSEEDFTKHQQNHKILASKKRTFQCKECNVTFSESKMFLNHVRKHQKQKCEICSGEFPSGSFKNHMAIHNKSLRLICEHCGLDFVSKMKLEEHLSLHKNKDLYVCKLCNCSFSNHGSFWIHKKWHESSLPYKCECGLSFRHSSVLAIHCRQNNCSRALTSNDNVGKRSKSVTDVDSPSSEESPPSSNLSSRVESNQQPLSSINGDSEKLKIAVTKFPKKHHKCEFCERTFPTTTSLAVHRLKHTNERPFKCERCSKGFSVESSLRKHRTSIVACDRQLKKRLSQSEAPATVSSVKILPKLDSKELHCPHCNISFPDFGSFVIHFCNKTKRKQWTKRKKSRSRLNVPTSGLVNSDLTPRYAATT